MYPRGADGSRFAMRKKLFFGVVWRYLAWSTGLSCGVGALLPSILIIVGALIWGLFLSELSIPEALASTEFGSLLLIMAYSIPIGLLIGVSIGIPMGVMNGLLVGLISVLIFLRPLNE